MEPILWIGVVVAVVVGAAGVLYFALGEARETRVRRRGRRD